MNAKSSTLAALVPAATKTGKCDLRPQCYVRKIAIGNDGRVTGAVYFDRQKREVFQRARAVVVSANGAETPRLLLQSKSNLFPQGLANTHGNIGKHLMFDAGGLVMGLCDHPVNDHKSVVVTRVPHDFYRADPKRGFYGGGGLDARMDYYPAAFASAGLPPGEPSWGPEWKKKVGEYYTRCTGTLAHSTCLAVEANSISRDDEVKDAWGLPAIRVTFQNHPDDVKTLQFLLERQKEILAADCCKKIWLDPASIEPVTHAT
jgi:choline dehydrogenase-like flavoprotein